MLYKNRTKYRQIKTKYVQKPNHCPSVYLVDILILNDLKGDMVKDTGVPKTVVRKTLIMLLMNSVNDMYFHLIQPVTDF